MVTLTWIGEDEDEVVAVAARLVVEESGEYGDGVTGWDSDAESGDRCVIVKLFTLLVKLSWSDDEIEVVGWARGSMNASLAAGMWARVSRF